jgi:DnaJ-class molecular chaperone
MAQCKCAGVGYRNNHDGSRDYKVVGDKKCGICRGSGYCEVCEECEGAGLFNSKPCYQCGGMGSVRLEPPASAIFSPR